MGRNRFRPLSGNKVSEQRIASKITREKRKVSVPSRGIRYLNGLTKMNTQLPNCFRPLSGNKVSELN